MTVMLQGFTGACSGHAYMSSISCFMSMKHGMLKANPDEASSTNSIEVFPVFDEV